jgi:hypothetical protein
MKFPLSSLKHIPTPKQFCSLNIAASTLHLSIPWTGGVHVTAVAETPVLAPLPSLVIVDVVAIRETETVLVCCCCLTSLTIFH